MKIREVEAKLIHAVRLDEGNMHFASMRTCLITSLL